VLLVVLVGVVAVRVALVVWPVDEDRIRRPQTACHSGRPAGAGLRAAATAPLGTVAGVLRSVGTTGGVGAETLEALGRAELCRLGLRLHAAPVGRVW